jgi:PhnB protein
MAKAKSHIPEGLRTVTAHLVVKNALDAIDFYKKAFGAELVTHSPGHAPRSTMHAAIKIGDVQLFLADEVGMSAIKAPTTLGATTSTLMMYVTDVDAVFAKAVAAGASAKMPVADQFWGDRYGQVADPFGHVWELATHKEDLTHEEVGQRAQAFFAQMAQQQQQKQ